MQDLYLALGNKSMQARHWQKVFKLLDNGSGQPPPNVRTFTFQQLLDDGLGDHKERVEEISGQASGEFTIEQTLNEITGVWQ